MLLCAACRNSSRARPQRCTGCLLDGRRRASRGRERLGINPRIGAFHERRIGPAKSRRHFNLSRSRKGVSQQPHSVAHLDAPVVFILNAINCGETLTMPPDAVTTTTDSTLHAALPAERRQLFEEGCARHKDAIAAVREDDLEAAL